MNQRPLTPRAALVLAYVIEHPGTTAAQCAAGTGIDAGRVAYQLDVLYVQRLIGRQHALYGTLAPATYWAEDAALSAYEAAQNKVAEGG